MGISHRGRFTQNLSPAFLFVAWFSLSAWSADLDPQVIGSYAAQGIGGGVKTFDHYALVQKTGGAEILDVSSPGSPVRIANVQGLGEFDLAGRILCILSIRGLDLYDLSNPRAPVLRGSCRPSHCQEAVGCTETHVRVEGSRAYLVSLYDNNGQEGASVYQAWSEVDVVDISNPAKPVVLGTYSEQPPKGEKWDHYFEGVAVSNGYVYLGRDDGVLEVVDATKPAHPSQVFEDQGEGSGQCASIVGTTLYLDGHAYDISSPEEPVRMWNADLPHSLYGAALCGQSLLYCFGENSENFSHPSWDLLTIWTPNSEDSPTLMGSKVFNPGSGGRGGYGVCLDGVRLYCLAPGVLRIVDVAHEASLQIVGRDASGHTDVLMDSGLAYIADNGVKVVDVNDPMLPLPVGYYETNDWAMDIDRYGSYAVIAQGTHGIKILDLSHPATPQFVGQFNTPGRACAVTVRGDLAFVSDGDAGVQIVNISNPWSPVLVGTCFPAGSAAHVALSGHFAYVSAWGGVPGELGVHVYDVSNPAQPVRVGHWGDVCVKQVVLNGSYAYALTQDGIRILDASNPAHPVQVGQYSRFSATGYMAMDGANLFLVTDYYFCVLDVVGGKSLVERATCWTKGTPGRFTLAGQYAYLPNRFVGGTFAVIDLSNRSQPKNVSVYAARMPGEAVLCAGDNAWIANGPDGCLTLSVANPLAPRYLGSWDDTGEAVAVAVEDNHIFAATREAGVQIIDMGQFALSYAREYVRVSRLDTPGEALDIAVDGDYAYVADGSSGLQVLNIHDPSAPRLVASQTTKGKCLALAVLGSYAYLAEGPSGIEVFNVAAPGNPIRSGGCDTKGSANGITVSAGYAYVADGTNGLEIIDVRNPASPQRIGGIVLDGDTCAVALDGNTAYVAATWAGLHAVDITNRSAPVRISGNTIPAARGVSVSRHTVYVAGGWSAGDWRPGGLFILAP